MTAKITGVLAALFLAAYVAKAETYVGTWTNTTFGSTGKVTVTYFIVGMSVEGSMDFDGNVFGGSDPAPIVFNTPINAMTGEATFTNLNDPTFGDVTGTFDAAGNVSIVMTNLPNGFDSVEITGKFNFQKKTYEGSYVITDGGVTFAQGVSKTHVPENPSYNGPKRVNFKSRSAKAKFSVDSPGEITAINAKATGKAKVKVRGSNPFKIILKKAVEKKTVVKLKITNEDGLSDREKVKFLKK